MANVRRVTISDLSGACGLSRSTVSRVITERGYVGQEARASVLRAIRDLGYRPAKKHKGESVRDLVMISTGLLASPVQIELIQSIVPAVEASGFKAMVAYNQFDPYRTKEYLLYARDRELAGVIFLGVIESPEVLTLLRTMRCPVVLLNQRIKGVGADIIALDDFGGCYTATNYLVSRGHGRIGLLMGPAKATAAKDRERGFRRACRDSGVQIRSGDVRYGDFTEESGMAFAKDILRGRRDITAVISCNDLMSAGLVFELERGGRRIPEDLSVIGFDNTFVTRLASAKLTTVDYDFGAIGRAAARMIVRRLEDPMAKRVTETFTPELVVRASVAAPRRA